MSGKIWMGDSAYTNNVVDHILEKRGLEDSNQKENFLNPSLRKMMPDPSVLMGMDCAVKIIAQSIKEKKKIAIFGDYDVDGITSTAILIKFFRLLGVDVIWHLPDRESEGYGLNKQSINDFVKDGAKTLITVDCGISAIDEVVLAKDLGMSVVITDHHEPSETIPNADAVVNPKQPGDTSGLNYLAGVGVAFMFIVALNRELGHPVDDMMQFLDLVALGTICDTMPLVKLNRAIVSSGLSVLEKRQNTGLKVLMDIANVKKVDSYAVGFILGPRLNAAGRIVDANLALNLILENNYLRAEDMASNLNDMNTKRQSIQNAILIDADEQAKKQSENGRYCLFVSGDGWHGGVMGIVAGRLKEKYGMPCCVATRQNGIINGSSRSIDGVDIGGIIHAAISNNLLISGGGHSAAAGFELDASKEIQFMEFLNDMVQKQLGGCLPTPKIVVDAEIDAGGIDFDLARNLSMLSPFGMGNPEPVLCLSGGIWTFGKSMGNTGAHITGNLKTSVGNLQCVGFNLSESKIGHFLLDDANFGARIRIAGKLKENEWGGRSGVQFLIEDIVLA
jgi:single-stranded-DNA-specific exonuclease